MPRYDPLRGVLTKYSLREVLSRGGSVPDIMERTARRGIATFRRFKTTRSQISSSPSQGFAFFPCR